MIPAIIGHSPAMHPTRPQPVTPYSPQWRPHVPRTRLGRLCLMLAVLLVLWTWPGGRAFPFFYYLAWIVFLGSLLGVGYRAFSRRFMWQLRNRLIVTYVFIGVIPVALLLIMGVVAGFLFAGQFSTFVVTTDLRNELQRLESANRGIAHQCAHLLRRGGILEGAQLGLNNEAFPGRQVTAYVQGKRTVLMGDATHAAPATPPAAAPESAIVLDEGELYLRAVDVAHYGPGENDKIIIVSSIPLDKSHLEAIEATMGHIEVYSERSGDSAATHKSANLSIGDTDIDISSSPKVSCGKLPPPAWRMDMELDSFTPVQNVLHWQTGTARHLLMIVRTRPSLLYSRLFRTLGEWTSAIYIGLTALAFFFALIEVAAFVIGMRLTRTMTLSVDKLYQATEHVNRGDLSHRIEVRSHDQMAALERSFNSMTGSLEKLIAEQKEKQRIESELQIAKEVQDLLFPRDSADLDGLELHGVCRPARMVSGDYYDFLNVGPNAVGLSVGDISGKGISAALMMATVHAFVRAHTLAEKLPTLAVVQVGEAPLLSAENISRCPSPGVVLAMLNQQLYRSTPEQKYATMFLGFYDQSTRRLTYSNAGHLPPILLRTDGTVERLETGGTVVGLFGDMVYPEGVVELAEGDIVVAFSDGITEPENDYGDFGEDRLAQIVEENRHLPLARISDAILAAVVDWIGGEEQPDDMTVVLARAR